MKGGSGRPETRQNDPQGPGADRKTEIQWGEVNGVRDPHEDRRQWRNTDTKRPTWSDRASQSEGQKFTRGSHRRNTDPRRNGDLRSDGDRETQRPTRRDGDPDPERETGTHKENHRPSGSPADGDATASGS